MCWCTGTVLIESQAATLNNVSEKRQPIFIRVVLSHPSKANDARLGVLRVRIRRDSRHLVDRDVRLDGEASFPQQCWWNSERDRGNMSVDLTHHTPPHLGHGANAAEPDAEDCQEIEDIRVQSLNAQHASEPTKHMTKPTKKKMTLKRRLNGRLFGRILFTGGPSISRPGNHQSTKRLAICPSIGLADRSITVNITITMNNTTTTTQR